MFALFLLILTALTQPSYATVEEDAECDIGVLALLG